MLKSHQSTGAGIIGLMGILLMVCSVNAQNINLQMRVLHDVIEPGDSTTFELKTTNVGPNEINDVQVKIQLPAFINNIEANENLICESNCQASETAIWNVETLSPGKSSRLLYDIQIKENAEAGEIETIATARQDTTSLKTEILKCNGIDSTGTFTAVDKEPKLIGGIDSLLKKMRYPELARRAGIEGRVFVQFVVSPLGNAVEPKIVRGLNDFMNEEAIRVIEKSAKFEPALLNGKPVCAQDTMAVTFTFRRENHVSLRTIFTDQKASLNEEFEYTTTKLVSNENFKLDISSSHGNFLPAWLNYEINEDARVRFYGKPTKRDSIPVEITATNEDGYSVFDTFSIIADNFTSTTNEEDPLSDTPCDFVLKQNYPNPFNPTTTITYGLPQPAEVQLNVYDVLGRRITSLVNQRQNAGFQSITFDATQLSSGMYIYRLEAGDFVQTRKMLLVK